MLDIGWSEFFVIAVVALIFLGPKELPRALYYLGRWTKAARKMTGEFQRHVDDIVRQAELDEMKKTVQDAAKSVDVRGQVRGMLDPVKELRTDIRKVLGPSPTAIGVAKASVANGATPPAGATPAAKPPEEPVSYDKIETAPPEPAASAETPPRPTEPAAPAKRTDPGKATEP
jgi:sec-independent protein translocase protein TatB